MRLKLNISTCPNDTYMFDALLHGGIDCGGLNFDLTLLDIEQLNHYALEGEADITKISYAAYPLLSEKYQILRSGSAIGRGNGPLLVSRRKIYPDELHDAVVAVPGEMTTANALLNRCFESFKDRRVALFSDISTMIMDGEVDCGVLIHEERFLYQQRGLQLIVDLGAKWEELTSKMIPLGAIAIRRDLPQNIKQQVSRLVACSVEYAQQNPLASREFVSQHAKELDTKTIEQHIEMFVNRYSIDITQQGIESVKELLSSLDFSLKEDTFI